MCFVFAKANAAGSHWQRNLGNTLSRRRGAVAPTPRGGRADAAEWSRRRRGVVASTPRRGANASQRSVPAQAAVNTLIALHAMPKGETEIRLTKDGAVAVERLSRARFFAVYVVYMARIALGVVLILFGSIYLVHTIEIDELILNAVALEFVLRVDELIYACFAPQRIKALIRHVRCRNQTYSV